MALNHWLITGGCGFIGVNLVRALLRNKLARKVRILDDLSIGTKEGLESVLAEFGDFKKACHDKKVNYHFSNNSCPPVELMIGDVRNKEIVEKGTRGVELLVHLAASTGVGLSVENPILDMEVNVTGTLNLLDASRQNRVQKFIFASSGASIGETEPPIHEKIAPKPVSPYGASKLAGEGYCSAYYSTFGIKTIALRFGNVYGPLSKHKSSVVAKFIRQAMNGEILEIYGNGKQTRDFIYIDDLTDAIILAANADTGGEVFQIATCRETTITEIAEIVKELVAKETGKKTKIIYVAPRPGDVKRNFSDVSKAKRILKFEAKYNLPIGLKRTFEYFNHNLQDP